MGLTERSQSPMLFVFELSSTRRTGCAVVLMVVGALCVGVGSLSAQIGLSPPKFDITIDKGGRASTHSIRVVNFDDKEVEVQVVVHNWDMDEQNQVRIQPPHEQSLDQWMVVSPLRFTIPPESSQVVRFSVRPLVEPEPGEHRAMLFFEQVPPEITGPEIRFIFRMGAAVYGQVGETVRVGELHSVTADGYSAVFEISSVGTANARMLGQYAVWPKAEYPGAENTEEIEGLETPGTTVADPIIEAGELPPTAVLPGTKRSVHLQFEEALEAGEYILDLNGSLGETVIDKAVSFSSSGEQVTRIGVIRGAEVVDSTVRLLLNGMGTARVELQGQYAVWRVEDYPGAPKTDVLEGFGDGEDILPTGVIEAGVLPAVVTMPRQKHVIEMQLRDDPPPGDYVLDLNGSLGERRINRGFPFSVVADSVD